MKSVRKSQVIFLKQANQKAVSAIGGRQELYIGRGVDFAAFFLADRTIGQSNGALTELCSFFAECHLDEDGGPFIQLFRPIPNFIAAR